MRTHTRYRITAAYQPKYANPIRFESGEVITLGGRDTESPEFLWATDEHGREGSALQLRQHTISRSGHLEIEGRFETDLVFLEETPVAVHEEEALAHDRSLAWVEPSSLAESRKPRYFRGFLADQL